MNITLIKPEDSAYPTPLRAQADNSPALGDLALLCTRLVALFCSVRCPGDAILRTYDLIRALRDAGIPVIGGFQSPMEKECLTLLLCGTQPVLILLRSPFAASQRRATTDLAQHRNALVAALSTVALLAHATPGSKTEALAREALARGKPVWTLDCESNGHLLDLGVQLAGAETAADAWKHFRTTHLDHPTPL